MILQYQETFKKQYKRLSSKLQQRCDERLHLFVTDSHHPQLRNHPLKGKYLGYWSINITGDVRAFYFKEGNNISVFALIGTHSQLYG